MTFSNTYITAPQWVPGQQVVPMPQLVFNHFFSSLEIKESIENQLHCWLLDKRQFFIQKSTATMIHTTLSYTLSSEIFGCPTLSALIISCDGTQIMRQSSKQIRVTDWKRLAPVILSSTINNIMPRRSIATLLPPPPTAGWHAPEWRKALRVKCFAPKTQHNGPANFELWPLHPSPGREPSHI